MPLWVEVIPGLSLGLVILVDIVRFLRGEHQQHQRLALFCVAAIWVTYYTIVAIWKVTHGAGGTALAALLLAVGAALLAGRIAGWTEPERQLAPTKTYLPKRESAMQELASSRSPEASCTSR